MGLFSALPADVSTKILEYLPQKSLLTLRLVNKHLNAISTPLAFQYVALDKHTYIHDPNQLFQQRLFLVQDRISRLLSSGLAKHIRELRIGPVVAPEKKDAVGMKHIEYLWKRIEKSLRVLEINAEGKNVDERFLWKARTMMREKPLESLNLLDIVVGDPCLLFQLYDGELRSRNGTDTYLLKNHTRRGVYFPVLEEFSITFGFGETTDPASFEQWRLENLVKKYTAIPEVVSMLVGGCSKLKKFQVVVDRDTTDHYGPFIWNQWPASDIFPFGSKFVASNIISLELSLRVRMHDTSKLLNLLSPMVNLRSITLANIGIDPHPNSPDWVDVFEFLSTLEDLRSYFFYQIGNEAEPVDLPEELREEDRIEGEVVDLDEYETTRWDMYDDRDDLKSYFECEHEALERLRIVVTDRRIALGLDETWFMQSSESDDDDDDEEDPSEDEVMTTDDSEGSLAGFVVESDEDDPGAVNPESEDEQGTGEDAHITDDEEKLEDIEVSQKEVDNLKDMGDWRRVY